MKRIWPIVALLALSATGAEALEAKVTRTTTAPAERAWAAVGDFCGIATWHPAVTDCAPSEKDGAQYRTLTLKDGAKLLEKLVARDEAARSYTYTIEEGPLPVAGYTSTLTVAPADTGSTFAWSGTFDAKGATDDEAVKTITGIYEGGLDALVAKTSDAK